MSTLTKKNYLIIGGIGGIGRAMVEQIIANKDHKVFATYYRNVPDIEADNLSWLPMDVSSEASIKEGIETVSQQTAHIDWVINCVGLLHTEQSQPEKALRQVETDFFMQNMQVNALAGLLIA